MITTAGVVLSAEVTIYSHHLVFNNMSPAIRRVLYEYCTTLVEYSKDFVPGRGYVQVPKKIYAASKDDRTEIRFHIHLKSAVFACLARNGYDEKTLHIVAPPLNAGRAVEYSIPDYFIPYDYQIPIIEYLSAHGQIKVITLQTGKGKCNSLDTPIKIPNGWSTMGAMEIGTSVITQDGSTTKVTGVFPQGMVDLYNVEFADGRRVECCKEHLWNVYRTKGAWANHETARTIDTEEIMRILKLKGTTTSRVYIDLAESEQNEDKELHIDPWLLGILIGDGCISRGSVTIATTREYIENRIRDLNIPGIEVYRYDRKTIRLRTKEGHPFNIVAHWLKRYGLMYKRAWEKHIPHEYLNGSTEQRRQLMCGLMDSDGFVQKSGSISYSTTSVQLAGDVEYLARSLGGLACIRPRFTQYTYLGKKRLGMKCYEVDMRCKEPSTWVSIPFKKERTNDNGQYNADLKLRVVSVEFSRRAEGQCISVENESRLYIVNDFIVTHNTLCALKAAEAGGVLTAIVVPGKYVYKWGGDVQETLGLTEDEITVIRGSKSLIKTIQAAKDGTLDTKFIIISSTTLYNYYKAYEKGWKVEKVVDGVTTVEVVEYGCDPTELYQLLEVGLRIIDETHENFHLNFKQDLYAHLVKGIYLSATLVADDPFTNRMLEIAYPSYGRYTGTVYDKYIAVEALFYTIDKVNKFKCINRRKQYNHVLFEESIMKDRERLKAYCNMAYQIVKTDFLDGYEAGQRMLIFCATKELCTLMSEYLRGRITDIVVSRYIGEDANEILYESDLTVTTLKSAGTAVDIDGLKRVLMTTAVSSSQQNLQALGRLRRMKNWPDETPKFSYLVASNIPKHLEYHYRKVETFNGKAKNQKVLQTNFRC